MCDFVLIKSYILCISCSIMIKISCLIFLFIFENCLSIDNEVDPETLIFGENNEKIIETSRDAIVGGKYVDVHETPYIAQIYQYKKPICGATIISPKWIVTAAHCIKDMEIEHLLILTGATIQGDGNFQVVVKIIPHEQYDEHIYDNDIALVEVSQPIEFNENQNAIEIATTFPEPGDVLQISGFGAEHHKSKKGSHQLKSAFVSVLDRNECIMVYTYDYFTKNMFCAGELGSIDSCQGDSGGPAVIDGKLVGVISWGYGCASKIFPGVYTQLLNYRQWIKNLTGV